MGRRHRELSERVVAVLPASSTLGFERRHNRAFRITDRAEFMRLMLEDIPPRPPQAEETRARNLGRAPAGV